MTMTLKELFDILENGPLQDYIVCLRYKYNHEKYYEESNEYIYYDPKYRCYVWLKDWNEGYTTGGNVQVVGFCPVSEIDIHGRGLF